MKPEAYYNNSQLPIKSDVIAGIITDLRSLIDQIDSNFKRARELVLELARKLDEQHICERDHVCRKVKEMLKDKIKENKITEKWIEECLPQEYKRRYIKSEVSSLSRNVKKVENIVVNNKGKAIAESSTDGSTSDNSCSIESAERTKTEGIFQIKQLEKPQVLENENNDYVRCQELEEEAQRKASPSSLAEDVDVICELASRLEKEGGIETNRISTEIAKRLRKYVTQRYVNEVLDERYKDEKHVESAKNRRTSSAKTKRAAQTIDVSEADIIAKDESQEQEAAARKSVEHDKLEALVLENSELKEALKKQTTLLSADQISANEIMFIVPKEKFSQLKEAMEISIDAIRLVFDKSGVLECAEPDIFEQQQLTRR